MFHSRRSRTRRSPRVGRVLVLDPCGRWHPRLWVYIVREHERGRQLSEILGDPFVREHASAAAIAHLLADPALVRRLRDDCRRPLSAPHGGARDAV